MNFSILCKCGWHYEILALSWSPVSKENGLLELGMTITYSWLKQDATKQSSDHAESENIDRKHIPVSEQQDTQVLLTTSFRFLI